MTEASLPTSFVESPPDRGESGEGDLVTHPLDEHDVLGDGGGGVLTRKPLALHVSTPCSGLPSQLEPVSVSVDSSSMGL